jgi:hypothetical protein
MLPRIGPRQQACFSNVHLRRVCPYRNLSRGAPPNIPEDQTILASSGHASNTAAELSKRATLLRRG